MAEHLFYNNIVALNAGRHAGLSLKDPDGDLGFAAQTHAVPLVGSEFYRAACNYPILFAGSDEEPAPVALLGLAEGDNLFVDSHGQWRNGTYVPAFIRRYPFILARGEGEDEDLTVCVDEEYGGLSYEEGEPLLDTEGQQTERMQSIVQFLQEFLAESERTRQFANRLAELDLLVRRDMQVTDAEGNNFLLRDFKVIDETKLDDLPRETVMEFYSNGFLGWIHAHLVARNQLEQMAQIQGRSA